MSFGDYLFRVGAQFVVDTVGNAIDKKINNEPSEKMSLSKLKDGVTKAYDDTNEKLEKIHEKARVIQQEQMLEKTDEELAKIVEESSNEPTFIAANLELKSRNLI